MNRSQIGYDGEHFACNSGGTACSNNCPGCWSRLKVAPRMQCRECRDNVVHLHPERLKKMVARKKPATILHNFTCDTFDKQRPMVEIGTILSSAVDAPQHTHIFLTQQTDIDDRWQQYFTRRPNWYFGCTIRDQQDAAERLGDFLEITGNRWISYEPAWEGIPWVEAAACVHCGGTGACHDPYTNEACECQACGGVGIERHFVEGIIIGHDNRKGAPGTDTLNHIYSAVEQAKAAGIKIYIKQLWVAGKFCKKAEQFPADLRLRELPWSPVQPPAGRE